MTFEEKTNEFIDCMVRKTKELQLFWEPIDYFLDNTENNEIIDLITKTEDDFISDDSFYAENHDSLLFAVHYKTKEKVDKYVLYGSVTAFSSPFSVPELNDDPDERFKEIWRLAKEQREYVLNEDGFPEPVYYFYRNMMAID